MQIDAIAGILSKAKNLALALLFGCYLWLWAMYNATKRATNTAI